MSKWTISVSGKGEFPWDMLRYDECYPASTDDALMMPAPLVPSTGASEREFWTKRRTVVLRSNKAPTIARWDSFGWTVTAEVK